MHVYECSLKISILAKYRPLQLGVFILFLCFFFFLRKGQLPNFDLKFRRRKHVTTDNFNKRLMNWPQFIADWNCAA